MSMDLLLVGAGGALGSLARYRIGRMIADRADPGFPVHTLAINFAGAFLLGALNGIGSQGTAALFAADGFLGAFTTFSTFMYEGFQLFKENEKKNAIVYITGTMILGILGYLAGFSAAKRL